MTTPNLLHVLKEASESNNGIAILKLVSGRINNIGLSYQELYRTSLPRAQRLGSLEALKMKGVVLLYMNNQLDILRWFWATIAAGGVPCIREYSPLKITSLNSPGFALHTHLNSLVLLFLLIHVNSSILTIEWGSTSFQ